ncbi:MAG: hypothetical protein IKR73_10195 [Oscillospiraceae bacterium]|nr:hypothetical protein [Oscillospiraceae bacterium]
MERIRTLDAAKGLGILMIMWGHMSFAGNTPALIFSGSKLVLFYCVTGVLM